MITATYGSVQSTTTATVSAVTAVQVSPFNITLDSGATAQLQANATIANSGGRDVTGEATWSSSDSTIVKVDNTTSRGLVTGVRPGVAAISASWKGTNGQTNVTSRNVAYVALARPGGAPLG